MTHPITPQKSIAESGFTLLEILVVLVLVALVSTIIMQGFYFATSVQARIKKQLIEAQTGSLQENWFRETVRSVQPSFDKSKNALTGTATELKGVSLTTLYGQTGIPAITTWKLKSTGTTSSLYYKINTRPEIKVATWNSTEVKFKYADAQGELHPTWPPNDKTSGLPKGVLISTPPRSQGFAWYVAISNTKTIDLYSFLNQPW
jgi:general secretion pathway protein J